MNQLKILPPEKARAKARAKVKAFQAEKRKRELRGQRAITTNQVEWEKKLRSSGKLVTLYVGETLEVEKNGVKIKMSTAEKNSQLYLVVDALGKRTALACQEGTTFNDGKKLSISITMMHPKHEPNLIELTIKVPWNGSGSAAEAKRINSLSQEEKNKSLWIASERGNANEVEDLLEHGAEIDSKNHNGMTALMLAANKGQPMVCTVLAAEGADLDATDDNGLTALDHAFMRGNKNTAMILIEKGAKAAAQLG